MENLVNVMVRENLSKKVSKKICLMSALLALMACTGVSKTEKTNDAFESENASTGREMPLDTFAKSKFADRAEELIYIRKYIEYRLPKVLIEAEPKKMEKALEELIGNGKNVTLEEAVKYTWMYDGAYKRLWYSVTQENLSFLAVKKKLSSFKTFQPKAEQEIEETYFHSENKRNDEVELPPVVEGKYNPEEAKIRGDFNGDGNLEYAFRVLTKKGYGNPVEDGVPDEYEIHFSDTKLKPVKVDCCWFELINEGDLNNDGSDELSIAQSPMNGCIGSFRTFTCKSGNCFELFEPFAFYSCNQASKKELQDLVTVENSVVYYRETDPDGGYPGKKRVNLKM